MVKLTGGPKNYLAQAFRGLLPVSMFHTPASPGSFLGRQEVTREGLRSPAVILLARVPWFGAHCSFVWSAGHISMNTRHLEESGREGRSMEAVCGGGSQKQKQFLSCLERKQPRQSVLPADTNPDIATPEETQVSQGGAESRG